ncbi:MAG: hypothetical protein R3F28_14465 [Candidatus Kapaibacterium sp.]
MIANTSHKSKYDMEALHHPYPYQEELPTQQTMDAMWRLFLAIGEFWEIDADIEAMSSNLVVFMSNRIQVNPTYVAEYANAEEVIDELISELGEAEAYKKLFTDPSANISPPTTKLARARQLVSNEFVALQLALGGFKTFGGAKNYLGYISGANIEGDTPYRTYTKEPK